MLKTSDYDKFATSSLSCASRSDSIIKIISALQRSPNSDPSPCHLGSLVCNSLATDLHPCQLPVPEQIISPHYTAG